MLGHSDTINDGSIGGGCGTAGAFSDAGCHCAPAGCVCCSTGNQCLLWADTDADDAAGWSAAVADFVAATPFFDRLNGWTRLGLGFDTRTDYRWAVSVDRPGADEGVETAAEVWRYAGHRRRYRLTPVGADAAGVAAIWGPAEGPTGWTPARDPVTGQRLTIDRYREQSGLFLPEACMALWVDVGGYTGSFERTDTEFPDDDTVRAVEGGTAADFYPPAAPGTYPADFAVNSDEVMPFTRQLFDRGTDPDGNPLVASPVPCDGIVWAGFALRRPPAVPPVPRGAGLAYPWEGSTDDARIALLGFDRVGAAAAVSGTTVFNGLTVDASETMEHSVVHGEEATANTRHAGTYTVPGGGPELRAVYERDVSVRLTRAAVCPELDTLPDNPCAPPAFTRRLGRACDDHGVTVAYDPATRPGTAAQFPTFLFGTRRYRATDEPTQRPAEAVDWSAEPCGPAGGLFWAEKCRLPYSLLTPERIVVERNPNIPTDAVTLVVQFPNPACPDTGAVCVIQSRYRLTDETADGPATPGALHVTGVACALPDWGRCTACPSEPTDPSDISRPSGQRGGGGGGGGGGDPPPDPMAAQMAYFLGCASCGG